MLFSSFIVPDNPVPLLKTTIFSKVKAIEIYLYGG